MLNKLQRALTDIFARSYQTVLNIILRPLGLTYTYFRAIALYTK